MPSSFVLLVEETEPAAGGGSGSLIFFLVMAVAFYFLFVRPQRKRQAQIKEVQESLELGADVRTIGGIHGRIVDLDEESVVLEVEEGRLRVARRGIAGNAE